MNINQVPDFNKEFPELRWRIERWGVVRGLVLLFSAWLGVTSLYCVVRTFLAG